MVEIYVKLEDFWECKEIERCIKRFFDEDEVCRIVCNPQGYGIRVIIARRHVVTLFLIIKQNTYANWLLYNGKKIKIEDKEFERLMTA